MDSIETHSFTSYSRIVMYLLLDILIPFGMSWVSNSSVLFHSFEATIFFFSHRFRHWLFYWTGQMISMEKRKWLRLWKMRVIVMFQSYCRQRQYIDTVWKIKHCYSIGTAWKMYTPGPIANLLRRMILKLEFLCYRWSNSLFEIGSTFSAILIGLKELQAKFNRPSLYKMQNPYTHIHVYIDRWQNSTKKSTPFVFIHRVNTKMSCHWMLHKRNIF